MGSDDEDKKKTDSKDIVAMIVAVLINLLPLFLATLMLYFVVLIMLRIWF